jgi:hypothetical protein
VLQKIDMRESLYEEYKGREESMRKCLIYQLVTGVDEAL